MRTTGRTLYGMGWLSTIRDALALPAAAAGVGPVPFESPWASPNHLVTIQPLDRTDAPVSRATAMGVPAVARARRIIVGSIARCPLEARAGGERIDPQPRWLTRTDGVQSPVFRMTWTVDDLFFYGWSLWGVERDVDGRVIRADRIPQELWAVDGDTITVQGREVDPTQVCLIPGPDEGLLNASAAAIRHAAKLNSIAQRAAETPNAQILLRQVSGTPLTKEEREALVGAWAAARRGENGGVAYANQSIEVVELGAANEHLLVEGRNLAAVDVARATGIPAALIDASVTTSTITYQNRAQRNAELIDYALAPYMAAIAGRLGLDDMVPRGTAVAFDLSDLTAEVIGELDVPDDDKDGGTPTTGTNTTSEVTK